MFMGILISSSCSSDFLEEQPFSFLSPDNLYNNTGSAELAIVGIYENLSSNNPSIGGSFNRGMLIMANFGTDDFTSRNNNDDQTSNYDNYTVLPSEDYVDATWENFFSGINQATSAINRLPDSPIDEQIKAQYIAEAKFMRGLFYFYLVRLYGEIPILETETTSLAETNIPKSSIEEVYNVIVKDFTEAESLLPNKESTPEGRATRAAALGFLSKIYLTLGSYGKYGSVDGYEWVDSNEAFSKSVEYGEEMLAITGYSLSNDYGDIFDSENSDEIIFTAEMFGGSGYNRDGSFVANLFAPQNQRNINVSRGGQARGVPTYNLYEKYEEGDMRLERNIVEFRYKGCEEFPHPGGLTILSDFPHRNIWAYAGKWRKPCEYNGVHFSTGEDIPLLRLADVMLMVAEADAEVNGGEATARGLELVKMLRDARFGGESPEITSGNFLDFIFDERSRELAYEGQRWFDLVRTNRLVQAVKNVVPIMGDPLGKKNIQDYHNLFPIPQTEIDNNTNISQEDQNPGY